MLTDDQQASNEAEAAAQWRQLVERRLAYRVLHLRRDVAGESGLPLLSAFRNAYHGDILAHCFVLSVTTDQEPRFDEIGSALRLVSDDDLVGRGPSAARRRTLLGEMAAIWPKVLARKVPIIREESFISQEDIEVRYRGILLPTSGDGRSLDTLFGVVNCRIMSEGMLMAAPFRDGTGFSPLHGKATTTSYEVYVMSNADWVVDSIHADRYAAVGEARDLLRKPGVKTVRVIEERFDEHSGESLAAIVFRQSKEENKEAPTFRRRPHTVSEAPFTRSQPKPAAAVRNLGWMLAGMGGLGVSALIGLAFLIDFLK